MARVTTLPRRFASSAAPVVAATTVTALFLGLMLVVAFLSASPAAGQEADPTTSEITTTEATSDGSSSVGNILPRPNTGQAPDSANDPGGWQQYLVFALIGLGLLAIVVFATRDSRRIRRAQGRYP